jgi:hypothetical protein
MSAEVGGRLEAVAPRRSLFVKDYWRIGILLAVAIAIHGWLVVKTALPARDSIGFARIANNLSDPKAGNTSDQPRQRMDIIREAQHPPGHPIMIWLTSKALKPWIDPIPDRTLFATQLCNAIAAVLLVIPLYLIGRIPFGRNVGFAGALLFQVLPVPARVTSDGLSEGVYLLVMAVAILMGVRAARRPGIGGFLLCGVATGASYLVRPEGLLVVFAVTAVIGLAWASRRWSRVESLSRLTALWVGLALVAAPYMVLIGKISNKTTPQYLIGDSPKPAILRGMPDSSRVATTGPALFAVTWSEDRDAGKHRALWAAGAVWQEMIKSMYYVVGALALLGVIAHRRQILAPDRGLWVLLMLGFLNLVLLFYLAAGVGYVSERHTVLFVMLACVFAAAALEPLALILQSLPGVGRLVIWPKAAPGGILLAVVVAALPVTLKPLHSHREGHKHAGRWLADNMGPNDWLKDPLAWGEWYAGRTLYNPVTYHGRPDTIWVITERGKGSPHSRLPQWEDANRLVALQPNRVPVYRWPADAPLEGPAVEVYKIDYDEVSPRPPAKPNPNPIPADRPIEGKAP